MSNVAWLISITVVMGILLIGTVCAADTSRSAVWQQTNEIRIIVDENHDGIADRTNVIDTFNDKHTSVTPTKDDQNYFSHHAN